MAKQSILVPLDGSQLSERALPYAVALAKASGASILIATVWDSDERAVVEQVPDLSPTVLNSIHVRGEAHWNRYLADRAATLEDEGVEVETELCVGDPADEICDLIERNEVSQLVIATHGRSGISRWRYGSVASRLLREAPVPTLVVGPTILEGEEAAPTISKILVPLDGSSLSETAIRPAAELAQHFNAELLFARVLQWSTQAAIYGVPDVDVAQLTEALTEGANAYLRKVAGELDPALNISVDVLRGAPAEALIALVAAQHVDLTVMASHTRGGVARAVLGSVADRLIQSEAPVYLIRPEVAAPAQQPERGRFCHSCGRAVSYMQILPEDKCVRCGQHLHACGNCVYFDGISCIAGRPEQHEPYPGQHCPYFHYRETDSPFKQPADVSKETNKE